MSVQAMSWAFAVRGISPSEKLVLLSLANYANKDAQCWPKQDTIAEETELSSRTVWNALKQLTEAGIIVRESRKRSDGTRTSDMFTLKMGQDQVAISAESSRNSCDNQSQLFPNPVATVATHNEPLLEPLIEPITTINARAPGDPNDWARMLAEATAAAGDQLDQTSTGVKHAADLRALVEPQSGEPCLWSEVIAAIGMVRTRSERTRKPIRSWSWIRDDAIKLRDIRLSADMPGVNQSNIIGGGYDGPNGSRAATPTIGETRRAGAALALDRLRSSQSGGDDDGGGYPRLAVIS